MEFARKQLKKTRFIAKITDDNQPSINLFEKLGYKLWKNVTVFQEVHYEFDIKEGDADKPIFKDLEFSEKEVSIN